MTMMMISDYDDDEMCRRVLVTRINFRHDYLSTFIRQKGEKNIYYISITHYQSVRNTRAYRYYILKFCGQII